MRQVTAEFITPQNAPKYNKRLNIHENGDNNMYPSIVESHIINSVTASRCAETMASYISGRGFGEEVNQLVVNAKKQTTLLRLLQDTADSIGEQKGFYIQVNYDANYDHKS